MACRVPLATGDHPYSGFGPPTPWIILELLMVLWFGRDVRWRLGRRSFWTVAVVAAVAASAAAVIVELAIGARPAAAAALPFQLMQGQRAWLAILVAAFASLYGDATVLLFFVLPLPARWILWMEIALAFVAFLATRDLAGLAGIWTAVGATVLVLPGSTVRRGWRRRYLSWRARRLERRLARLARERGLRVLHGDGRDDQIN